ncbi:MAG TPA: LamG-like jellyroll fold domain-containing protein [Candidatus Nanoarchaeia archaeon]|nr:LamG-like jellyroll fold domain-containing protein [Candidatus Nanoarchaeia archaeon]
MLEQKRELLEQRKIQLKQRIKELERSRKRTAFLIKDSIHKTSRPRTHDNLVVKDLSQLSSLSNYEIEELRRSSHQLKEIEQQIKSIDSQDQKYSYARISLVLGLILVLAAIPFLLFDGPSNLLTGSAVGNIADDSEISIVLPEKNPDAENYPDDLPAMVDEIVKSPSLEINPDDLVQTEPVVESKGSGDSAENNFLPPDITSISNSISNSLESAALILPAEKIISGPVILDQPVQWKKILFLSSDLSSAAASLPSGAYDVNLYLVENTAQETKTTLMNQNKLTDLSADLFANLAAENQENKHLELIYFTPGPTAKEIQLDNSRKQGKKVVVQSLEGLPYQNVTAFTAWDELLNTTNPGKLKVKWVEGGITISPKVEDKDNDGIYDYVEWIVPHLSVQTFEIIVVDQAQHLDANREFISDIYAKINSQDGIWSEPIPETHYVRVYFEKNLTTSNDLTIFARGLSGKPSLEVYEVNSRQKIAEFSTIYNNNYQTVYLHNLISLSQDVFDLKIAGGNLQFDLIIDPPRVMAGLDDKSGSTVPKTVILFPEMRSINYSVLLAGGADADTAYSLMTAEPNVAKSEQDFSFSVKDDTNTAQPNENVSWIAIDWGDHNLNGTLIKCGNISNSGDGNNGTITFPTSFPNTSYSIFGNSIVHSDAPLINYINTTRAVGSINISVEEDTGTNISLSGGSYCAISHGEFNFGSVGIKAGNATTAASGDTTVTFNTPFFSAGYSVVAMAGNLDTESCAPEIVLKTKSDFIIHFEQDTSTNCPSRAFDWVAVLGGFDYSNSTTLVVNETNSPFALCGDVISYTNITVQTVGGHASTGGVLSVCGYSGPGTGYANVSLGRNGSFVIQSGGKINLVGGVFWGGGNAVSANCAIQGVDGNTSRDGEIGCTPNGGGGGGGDDNGGSVDSGAGAGGGFGGVGGMGENSSLADRSEGGRPYGGQYDLVIKTGSGGGGQSGDNVAIGDGGGGGAGLKVDAGDGFITINGVVNLSGGSGFDGDSLDDSAGGGGSGGHLILIAKTLVVSNSIINISGGRGGDGDSADLVDSCAGGGGGGGRILYVYESITNTSTINEVSGGAKGTSGDVGCTNSGGEPGGNGTIGFLQLNILPKVDSIRLNTTTIALNKISENLTLYYNSTDGNSDPVKSIIFWYANNAPTMVLYNTFERINETNSSNLRDYSGNGNNATDYNQATWNATGGFDSKGMYSFDGDDQINFSSSLSLNLTLNYTICTWLSTYAKDIPAAVYTLISRYNDGTNRGFAMRIAKNGSKGIIQYIHASQGSAEGGLVFNILESTTSVNDSRYYHTCATFDTVNGSVLYVNGVKENFDTRTKTAISTYSQVFMYGAQHSTTPRQYNGTLDDVMIFNRSLHPVQINSIFLNQTNITVTQEIVGGDIWKACIIPNDGKEDGEEGCSNNLTFNTKPAIYNVILNTTNLALNNTNHNLTLYYNFTDADSDAVKNITKWYVNTTPLMVLFNTFERNNETNSSNLRDYSGNGNNATDYNQATWNATGGFDSKGMYSFDGNDQINFSSSLSLNLTLNYTICAWLSTYAKDIPAAVYTLISRYNDGTNRGFALRIAKNGSKGIIQYIHASRGSGEGGLLFNIVESTTSVNDSRYYHTCATFDDVNGSVLYVNGVKENFDARNKTAISTYSQVFMYGAQHFTTPRQYNGTLDEVMIFNRSLHPVQIQSLFLNKTNIIVSQELKALETWQACVIPNDQNEDGAEVCSNNVTVRSANAAPGAPVLVSPANNTFTTNRTTPFTWNNSVDADADILSYRIEVDDSSAFNNPEINVSSILQTNSDNTTFYPSTELSVDKVYYWRVFANDSSGEGSPSSINNFTVQSFLAISVYNNVSFGSLSQNQNATTPNNATAFRAENLGNIFFNVTLTATQYFFSVPFPSIYYSYKIRANESSAFDTVNSNMDWTQMNETSNTFNVINVDWHDVKNDFLTDINVSVPENESSGLKSSTVTFTITGEGS